MQILNQLETEPIPIEEEEKRHMRRLLVGVLCALILTGSVLGGYLFLRKRHERQVAAAESTSGTDRIRSSSADCSARVRSGEGRSEKSANIAKINPRRLNPVSSVTAKSQPSL